MLQIRPHLGDIASPNTDFFDLAVLVSAASAIGTVFIQAQGVGTEVAPSTVPLSHYVILLATRAASSANIHIVTVAGLLGGRGVIGAGRHCAYRG